MPTRLDPHVHASASSCSRLTDEEFLQWAGNNPNYFPLVADHQSLEFYERHGQDPRLRPPGLLGLEVTLGAAWADLLLLTAEPEAFAGLHQLLWHLGRAADPSNDELRAYLHDPRILLIWAHPLEVEFPLPAWLVELPLDFLEVNAARLSFMAKPERVRDHVQALDSIRHDVLPHPPMLIAGSDSHQDWTLGTSYNQFYREVESAEQAIEMLRRGAFRGHVEVSGFHGQGLVVEFEPKPQRRGELEVEA